MDYIGRAEKAIRTGQPRLAMLYMRRALSETPEGRMWLAWFDIRAAVQDTIDVLAKHLAPVLALVGGLTPDLQQDYRLAGPPKGTP